MGLFEILNKDKLRVRATSPKVKRLDYVYLFEIVDMFHVTVSALEDFSLFPGNPFMVAHFGDGHLEKLVREGNHVLRNLNSEDERRRGVRVFYDSVVGYFGSVEELDAELKRLEVEKRFTNQVGIERLKLYERVFLKEKPGSELLAWYSASEEYWKGVSIR
jgi:hypothetical protein